MNTKTAIKNVADVPNKFNIAGGNITGNITLPNDTSLMWSRNTDYAKILFKNTADSDSDSYMHFLTGDNGNEYFKFSSISGGTTTDWLTIKSDHLRFKGNAVYHTANKPTPADIGAAAASHTHNYLPLSGGTLTGTVTAPFLNITDNNGYRHNSLGAGDNHVIGVSSGIVYLGNPQAKTQIEGNSNPTVLVGSNKYTMYHTGNKPTPADIGAAAASHSHNYLPLSGGTMTGTLALKPGGSTLTGTGIATGNTQLIGTTTDTIYFGNPKTKIILESNSTPSVSVNGTTYTMYHTGNKPTPADIGAIPSSKITVSQTAPSNPSTGDLWISW